MAVLNRTTTEAPSSGSSALARIGSVVFWLAVWQGASMLVGSSFILAGPLDTAAALARLVPTGSFWSHVAFSATHIVAGTALGYLAAGACTLAAHRLPALRLLLRPAMAAVKSTPIACIVVILLIWLGSRNASTAAVFLMVLPAIYFPMLRALDSVDPRMRELADVFGMRGARRALAVIWPHVLPYLRAASETALSMSWKAGVAAELIGTPMGSIGERIYQAKLLLETADLFAWTVTVIAVAWLLERVALMLLDATWPAAGSLAVRLARSRRGSATSPAGDEHAAILSASELVVGHDGLAAAGPFTFTVRGGEALVLMGPSGAGKTTLLSTIARQCEPRSGMVQLAAETNLSVVFQDARLIDQLSCLDNMLLVAPGSDARALLAELGLAEVAGRPAGTLSGGQRRRLELARALAAPTQLTLLDEPFTGLDEGARDLALTFLDHHRGDRAIVLSTHDPRDAERLGARILRI